MFGKSINIAVAVTGASGAIYAKVLFDTLVQHKKLFKNIAVVMSDNAKYVWQYELDNTDYKNYPFIFFDKNDFMAPFASGSSSYQALIICPCSMGTLGRIATGISNDLVTRAADVMLKERRKLILVTRDTPLNLIHIKNMETVTLAGGIICPATPSFYSKPKTFEELAKTVTDRALSLAGVEINSFRWNEEEKE
jgi:4-hydroxy-3-polyprenylbenzoate decarboxylase